jgi:hypothetical protein
MIISRPLRRTSRPLKFRPLRLINLSPYYAAVTDSPLADFKCGLLSRTPEQGHRSWPCSGALPTDITMIAPPRVFVGATHRRNSKVPASLISDQRPTSNKEPSKGITSDGTRSQGAPPHGVIITHSFQSQASLTYAHEAKDVISIFPFPIINTSCAPPPRPWEVHHPISNPRRSSS